MKLPQYISEYRLCGRSGTLSSALLRSEYLKLLWQCARESREDRKPPSGGAPHRMRFLGKDLHCFHRESVVSLYREIFIYQHYNPPITLGDKPVIVDAGGNIGMFSIYASMVFPGASIRTFEADPTTFAALKINLDTYVGGRAKVHNVALADRSGTTHIVVDGDNPNRCTNTILADFLSKSARRVSAEEVPLAKLSDLCDDLPRVDFMKMDIEGAEFPVFDDLYKSGLLRRIGSLAMEVHRRAYESVESPHRLSGFLRQLEEVGFAMDFFARAERPFGLKRLDETFMIRAWRKS